MVIKLRHCKHCDQHNCFYNLVELNFDFSKTVASHLPGAHWHAQ